MHQFPEDFNKDFCKGIIQQSDNELIATCRKTIHDCIIANASKSIKTTNISFPADIKKDTRVDLCGELIKRFDGLDIVFNIKERGSSYPLERNFSEFSKLKEFISEHNMYGIAINEIRVQY